MELSEASRIVGDSDLAVANTRRIDSQVGGASASVPPSRMLIERVATYTTINAIARIHERSLGGIVARLEKLEVVDETNRDAMLAEARQMENRGANAGAPTRVLMVPTDEWEPDDELNQLLN